MLLYSTNRTLNRNTANQVKKDYLLMAVADLILKLNEREDTKCGWWNFDINEDSDSMSVDIKFNKDQA